MAKKQIKLSEYIIRLVDSENNLKSEKVINAKNEKDAMQKGLYYRTGFVDAKAMEEDEYCEVNTVIEISIPDEQYKANSVGFKNNSDA